MSTRRRTPTGAAFKRLRAATSDFCRGQILKVLTAIRKPPQPTEIVFLASSARSGSTWLAEMLNFRGEYRVLFEPFWPERVRSLKDFRLLQYAGRGDTPAFGVRSVDRIMCGHLYDPWFDRSLRGLLSTRILVKDIRANLMLGWIKDAYPEAKVLLLVRHPVHVALSKLRMGWRAVLPDLLTQPLLVERYAGDRLEAVRRSRDEFLAHIAVWCVEYVVPLSELRPTEVEVVFYEELVRDPVEGNRRILSYLGHHEDTLVTRRSARRPSRTAYPDWSAHPVHVDLDAARDIIAAFGLDTIYQQDGVPNRQGLRETWQKLHRQGGPSAPR